MTDVTEIGCRELFRRHRAAIRHATTAKTLAGLLARAHRVYASGGLSTLELRNLIVEHDSAQEKLTRAVAKDRRPLLERRAKLLEARFLYEIDNAKGADDLRNTYERAFWCAGYSSNAVLSNAQLARLASKVADKLAAYALAREGLDDPFRSRSRRVEWGGNRLEPGLWVSDEFVQLSTASQKIGDGLMVNDLAWLRLHGPKHPQTIAEQLCRAESLAPQTDVVLDATVMFGRERVLRFVSTGTTMIAPLHVSEPLFLLACRLLKHDALSTTFLTRGSLNFRSRGEIVGIVRPYERA